MAAAIYGICALTALACAMLLLASFASGAQRIFYLSGLCFGGMFLENMLLFVNRLIFPGFDLSTWRLALVLASMLLLLYGLIFWGD